MASEALTPTVRWAPREDLVYLKIDVVDAKEEKLDLSKQNLKFACKSDNHTYVLDLELFGEIDPEKSKWSKKPRYIEMCLLRPEEGEYWPRLLKVSMKNKHYLYSLHHFAVPDLFVVRRRKWPRFRSRF